MKTIDVAILGGGLAGLNAARLLHRAGIPFQLFEARDRLGGRILTVDETGMPDTDGFDLGPSWFWPGMQPQLTALVSDLGLRFFAQHTARDMLFERSLRELPQRVDGAGLDQGSMRLVGGMGTLVRALAKVLPAACIRWRDTDMDGPARKVFRCLRPALLAGRWSVQHGSKLRRPAGRSA